VIPSKIHLKETVAIRACFRAGFGFLPRFSARPSDLANVSKENGKIGVISKISTAQIKFTKDIFFEVSSAEIAKSPEIPILLDGSDGRVNEPIDARFTSQQRQGTPSSWPPRTLTSLSHVSTRSGSDDAVSPDFHMAVANQKTGVKNLDSRRRLTGSSAHKSLNLMDSKRTKPSFVWHKLRTCRPRMKSTWSATALLFSMFGWTIAAADSTSGTPLRAECTRNNIISLQISKIEKLAELTGSDLCHSNAPAIPEKVSVVLNTVGSVQERVARTLGTSRQELFSKGIDLTLTSWALGSLDEGASGNSVTISFFPDWDGEPIDQPGLAHELGHVMAGTSSEDMAIHSLRGTSLLSEGFPDLVAYATFGRVFDHKNDLPAVVDALANRNLDILTTYRQQLGFFLDTYIFDRGQKVCASLPSREQKSPHVVSVCSYLNNPPVNPIESYYRTLSRASEPFSANACEEMSADTWQGPGCDVHQLSRPFTSFLAALSKPRRGAIVNEAVNLLTRPGALPMHSYSCHYQSDSGKAHSIEVSISEFSDLTERLKDDVDPVTWKSLWNQTDLDAGMELEKADTDYSTQRFAYNKIKELYNQGNDSFYNSSNPCFSVETFGFVSAPVECKIDCERT
jgi:hypothetical protein